MPTFKGKCVSTSGGYYLLKPENSSQGQFASISESEKLHTGFHYTFPYELTGKLEGNEIRITGDVETYIPSE